MAVSPLEERYRTEMNAIFEEESRLRKWIAVEVALAKAHAKLGNAPKEAAAEIEKAGKSVTPERVKQIENEIHHDLMAMVRALTEKCPKEYGKYVHLGATSYDIEDTATALMFCEAISILENRLGQLGHTLAKLALENKERVCIGRTHGQHAVPTTYGMKFALYFQENKRNLERLAEAKKHISVGKMSGAVGTMATFGGKGFEVQELVMKELGLEAAKVTNQVIQRDRHAEVLFDLALVAAECEKIAKEIRNLQRTELMEAAEAFGAKQVGSSTMPHKRNPHKSERICSLARVVRANVQTALENIALEHERDLTNSANERYIFAESFITTDYMASELLKILKGIQFFDANIERNLELTNGLVMAERVMIALSGKGMGRQEAHELVRLASTEAFEKKKHLRDVLAGKKEVKKLLGAKELAELFNPRSYIGEAKKIVERAVG